MRLVHGQRGQALVETAIFMPIFLICLFGLIWVSQISTLSERVQSGVRYGGQITERGQPYLNYSIFSIYATIDGVPPLTPGACSSANVDGMSTARASFFKVNSVTTNTCNGSTYAFNSEGLSDLVILQNDYVNLSVQGAAPNYLIAHGNGSLGNTTGASQNFFRSPDLQTLTCETEVGNLLKASLEGFYDQSAANLVIPSAFPQHPTATFRPVQPCVSFSSQPLPTVDTPIPVPSPYTPPAILNTPTPAPTGTGTISPATASPVGATPTPTPTPAPLPTATVAPTAASSPGNVS